MQSHTEALVAAAAAAVAGSISAEPGTPLLQSASGLDIQERDELKRLQKLGQGASGTVEKHQHLRTGKMVALKIISAGDISEPQRKAIFLELRTFAKCRSPHIVQFYGAFNHDNQIHIALEYMGAGALSDILEVRRTVPEPVLAHLTWQVLDGLEYLHTEMRVIHRDIKPSNLVISEEGVLKLTDFGVSGELSDELAQSSKQTWVGTVHYMSPERVLGNPYKFDSDLWSLGLTLVECLTGRFPYALEDKEKSKKDFSVWELMKRIAEEDPPHKAMNVGQSEQVSTFIDATLQKEPTKRPAAAALKAHAFLDDAMNEARQQELVEWITGAREARGPASSASNPFGLADLGAGDGGAPALGGSVRWSGNQNPFGDLHSAGAGRGGPAMGESVRGVNPFG